MLRAKRRLMCRECSLGERQSLRGASGVEKQARIVALIAMCVRMSRAVYFFSDGNRPAEVGFRFVPLASFVQ